MEHYFSRLQNATRLYWDKPAIRNFRGETFTYGQMATQIERFHIFFDACGLKKGDKIAICAKNTARMALSFLAVNTSGKVVVPILCDFTPDSVNWLVDHSESLILFTDNDIWDKLDITKMPALKAVICVNDFSLLYGNDEVKEAYSAISANFAAKYPMGFTAENVVLPVDNWDELAVINYTSGTTSAPKGVMLTYKALSANVDFGQRYIPSSDKYTMVSMLPMAHMYGLMFEFLYPLCNGTSITFLGKTPSPTLLLSAMKEVRPYLLITVPLVMEKIYKSSLKPALSKPLIKFLTAIPGVNCLIYKKVRETLLAALGGNIQMIIMGGAPLNPEVEKCFKKLGLPYTVGYGMTEAAPLLAYEACDKYVPGSCGKAVDCATVRIDSEDPQHVVGEIQAKGDNICLGYFKNEEASASAFTDDGYLRTGDLGIIDAEGNIFIRGRSKSMILSANGQNIYPEEVEAVINSQNFVVESVVVDRAAKLVGLVYLDQDAIGKAGLDPETVSDIPEQIRNASNKVLPSYSKLTKVEVVDKPFEKTPKMSIKRFMYK
ncbi:MAG: AMP-binding protein [Candidatus Cryptobacteroides sp.]